MSSIIEEVSTITSKGQTTVPSAVRKVLGASIGTSLRWRIEEGRVSVVTEDEETFDPAIAGFLAFLAKDLTTRPQALSSFPPPLRKKIRQLTKAMNVDPSDPIEGDVDL